MATSEPETCDSPVIRRLELVPHSMEYRAEDGELQPTGENDSLLGDLGVAEKKEFTCTECEAEFDDEEEALDHIQGNGEGSE